MEKSSSKSNSLYIMVKSTGLRSLALPVSSWVALSYPEIQFTHLENGHSSIFLIRRLGMLAQHMTAATAIIQHKITEVISRRGLRSILKRTLDITKTLLLLTATLITPFTDCRSRFTETKQPFRVPKTTQNRRSPKHRSSSSKATLF